MIPEHAPMREFPVDARGELTVGGLPLTRLAERVGRTPFYAYDRSRVCARVARVRAAIGPEVRLHYAIKANPFPPLVALLARETDGFDVASGGEMALALDCGIAPERIAFAGPGKRDEELRQALAAEITITLESERELPRVLAHAESLGIAPHLALRLNPDFELKRAGMKMGGGAKPFGIDLERAPALLESLQAAGLALEGLHLYAGSQSLDAETLVAVQRASFDRLVRLAERLPAPPRWLNLGGGFGIPYFPGEQPLALEPVGENLRALAAELHRLLPATELVIELGRYLVGEAGLYVCRVLDKKRSRDTTFLVVDGGLHQHLAASGNFGQVIRKNYPVAIGNKMHLPASERVTVVGPLCTPLDILAQEVLLPPAEPGDLFVVYQSGAYGASASPRAFLSHPDVTETLV